MLTLLYRNEFPSAVLQKHDLFHCLRRCFSARIFYGIVSLISFMSTFVCVRATDNDSSHRVARVATWKIGPSLDFSSILLSHREVSDFDPAIRGQVFNRANQVGDNISLGLVAEAGGLLGGPFSMLLECRYAQHTTAMRDSHDVQVWRGNLYDSVITPGSYDFTTSWKSVELSASCSAALFDSHFEVLAGLSGEYCYDVQALDSAVIDKIYSWYKPTETPRLPTSEFGSVVQLYDAAVPNPQHFIMSLHLGLQYRIRLHHVDIVPGLRYEHSLNSMYLGVGYQKIAFNLRAEWQL